jgi:hypothetical protein
MKGPNGFVFSTPEIRLYLQRKRRLTESKIVENNWSSRQNDRRNAKHNNFKRPLSHAA